MCIMDSKSKIWSKFKKDLIFIKDFLSPLWNKKKYQITSLILVGLGTIIITIVIFFITNNINDLTIKTLNYDTLATKLTSKMDNVNVVRPFIRGGVLNVESDLGLFRQAYDYYLAALRITSGGLVGDLDPKKSSDFFDEISLVKDDIDSFEDFETRVTPVWIKTLDDLNNLIVSNITTIQRLQSRINLLFAVLIILQVINAIFSLAVVYTSKQ